MSVTVHLPLILGSNIPQSLTIYHSNVKEIVSSLIPAHLYYLKFSPCQTVVRVYLRLPGGKGGFGSQLRAQGNKMSSKKRAGNYEACRDLSGQRLRSQKQAKLIEEYLEKEPERLSLREQEIRDKMQRHLDAPNKKVMFNDPEYLKTSRKIVDGAEDAVRAMFANEFEEQSESEDEEESGSEDKEESGSEDDEESNEDEDDEKAPMESKKSKAPLESKKSTPNRLDKELTKYL